MSKSKQVNFFIRPDEHYLITNFLKKNESILIRKESFKEPNALEINMDSSEENLFQVYITKEEFRDDIYFKYLQSKDYYYVDVTLSHAVEFSIGGFYPYSDKDLHRSRLYVVTEFYEGQKLVKKSQKFVNWAADLIKNFKKEFLITSPVFPNIYFSESCLSWLKTNNAKVEAGGQKFLF